MSGFIEGEDRHQATLSLLQFLGILRSKLLAPLPNGFSGDGEAAFGREVFNFAKAQAEAMRQPHGVTDHFGRNTMALVAGWGSCH